MYCVVLGSLSPSRSRIVDLIISSSTSAHCPAASAPPETSKPRSRTRKYIASSTSSANPFSAGYGQNYTSVLPLSSLIIKFGFSLQISMTCADLHLVGADRAIVFSRVMICITPMLVVVAPCGRSNLAPLRKKDDKGLYIECK